MKKARVSSQGKLVGFIAAFWATVLGGSIIMHEYVVDPAPPPTPLQSLQSEFTAAVAARVEGIAVEQRGAVALEKLCGETATTLTTTFQNAGIAATFTAPYEAPDADDPYGACVLSVNGRMISVINAPDEFENEFVRKYVNETIMKMLSPEALQRLGNAQPGIPKP